MSTAFYGWSTVYNFSNMQKDVAVACENPLSAICSELRIEQFEFAMGFMRVVSSILVIILILTAIHFK